MKTKDEIRDWLLENASNEYGNIDLSDIDFGDKIVFNSCQKASKIFNSGQRANTIFNDYQQAKTIYNHFQEANEIYNDYQKANEIDNRFQVIKPKYENMTKEQLIDRIKELENE